MPAGCPLLAGAVALLASAAPAQSPYQPLIDRWAAEDALDPPPAGALLFTGSSSMRLWEHLSRDFAAWNVMQRGFGGSTWDDLNQFVDELVAPYDPAVIVVYEGSNDITNGSTPAEALADFRTFIDLVRAAEPPGEPPTPIVHVALVPAPGLWSTWPQRQQYNSLVAALAEADPTIHYADVATPILATGAPPSASLFSPDQVHLNEAGYAVWTAVIRPKVAQLAAQKHYVPNPLHPPAGRRLLVDLGPSNPADGEPTHSPDPFGSSWNNWHPLVGLSSSTLNPELAGQVFAGEHKGDLVTTSGEHTGIDLVVTGGFYADGKQSGGLLAPSPALLHRFAVPQATMDFFYSTNHTTPAGLMLTGLNPALTYDLRFFGSRSSWESLITVYGVKGYAAEESASLQVSGLGIGGGGSTNGNDDSVALVAGVRPDAFGQVFIDLHGGPGEGTPATLNLMELWVRGKPKPGTPSQHP
jgi:lysophospholipase L1-like esterase